MHSAPSGELREAATRRVSLTFSGNDAPLRAAATARRAGALAKAHEAAEQEGNTEVAISAASGGRASTFGSGTFTSSLADAQDAAAVLEQSTDCTTSPIK